MTASQDSTIALGRFDPWRRTPHLEFRDGKVAFLPGEGVRDVFKIVEAPFPPGSRIEYRVERGDHYYTGDHGQAVARTLCVVGPEGKTTPLVTGFVIYVNRGVTARNLKERGIPFQAVTFYKRPNGEEIEIELWLY